MDHPSRSPLVRRARKLPSRALGSGLGLQEKLPRYAYFPFGGGPRLCIGNNFALMEAALLLATIARRFRLRLASDAVVTSLPTITLPLRTASRSW